VTRAGFLAFAAAACATVGTWQAAAAVEGSRAVRVVRRAGGPLRRAARGGAEPSAAERRTLTAVAMAAALVLSTMLAGLLAGVLCCTAAPMAVRTVAGVRRRRDRDELQAGAPAAARALADALGAGHSVRGALMAAAAGVPGAAGRELRRAAGALRLGEETAAVLEALRRRAAAPAWDTLAAAVLLQREAGGDLAGLLRHLAASLEAAERHEAQARTATAQARFTAWLVAGMPFGAAVLVEIGSPGFLAGLAAHPLSATLAAGALVLQVAAIVLIRRLLR
jgi:tight adherence protein B